MRRQVCGATSLAGLGHSETPVVVVEVVSESRDTGLRSVKSRSRENLGEERLKLCASVFEIRAGGV